MTYAIILTSALLAIALAVALVREHRLRKALESLLKRLTTAWRHEPAETESSRRLEKLSPDSAANRSI